MRCWAINLVILFKSEMSIRKEAEELRAHFITHDEEHHECRHCGKLCEFGDRVSYFRRHALQCESLMKSVSAKKNTKGKSRLPVKRKTQMTISACMTTSKQKRVEFSDSWFFAGIMSSIPESFFRSEAFREAVRVTHKVGEHCLSRKEWEGCEWRQNGKM